MTPTRPSRLRRTFRLCWRSARTLAVVLLLILVALAVHLHNVGLPEPVKSRLLDAMLQQGWEVDYARLRFRWMAGIVGEGLHFRPAAGRPGPELFVDRVDFRLNRADLENFIFTPEVLLLTGGRCLWTLHATNESPRTLALESVNGTLRFREPDEYHLESLSGSLHGMRVRIECSLTNASYLNRIQWPRRPSPRTGGPGSGVSTETFLHELAGNLRRCKPATNASMVLRLMGDVPQTHSFSAELDFQLPGIESPWLNGSDVRLWARVFPPQAMRQPFELRWRVEGTDCRTPWGDAGQLSFSGDLRQRVQEPTPDSGRVQLEATHPETRWVRGTDLSLKAAFEKDATNSSHFMTRLELSSASVESAGWSSRSNQVEGSLTVGLPHFTPLAGRLKASVEEGRIRAGSASALRLDVTFQNPETNLFWFRTNTSAGVRSLAPSGSPWSRLEAMVATLEAGASGVSTPGLEVPRLDLSMKWLAPGLLIDRLEAGFNRGVLQAQAGVNVRTREVTATLTNTTDAHLLVPVLGTNAGRWLSQFGWKEPPWVRADARITLPAWSHFLSRLDPPPPGGFPDIPWNQEAMPSFRLDGQVRVAEGDYRGATFSSATLSLHGSNQVWRLPDIVAVRPEGILELAHESDEATKDYVFRFRSGIDPRAMLPVLPASAREAFDLFDFGAPPGIVGEIRGRWRSPERLTAWASLTSTNLAFRGEKSLRFDIGRVEFGGRLVKATNLLAIREEGQATVGEVWYDLDEKKVRLTNAISTLAVAPVCRAIGSNVAAIMQDYRFEVPPRVRLEGLIDTLKARRQNDLRFVVEGTGFGWKLFNLSRVNTEVVWRSQDLQLNRLTGGFYGGEIAGDAHFDFSGDSGTEFQFGLTARDVDLSLLMGDISSKTNRLEGRMDCRLTIDRANTRDKFTWNGHGEGSLTNGLLWDIPVFALLSPALNAIAPGMGNSRAKQALGTFVITNGVIHTEDMEIRATGMRMKSQGSVDFDKAVNARMEAELLRDTPAIGFLLSKIFWPVTKLFEFKITGTLDKPRTDQMYMVPRILMAPLHPIRTIKGLFKGSEKKAESESPPPASEPAVPKP